MEDTGGGYGCREDPSVERMNITPEHIASWLGMVEPNNIVTESSQNLITVSFDQLAEMCNSIHKLKGLPCGVNDMNQLRRSSDGSHSSSSSRNSYRPPHLRLEVTQVTPCSWRRITNLATLSKKKTGRPRRSRLSQAHGLRNYSTEMDSTWMWIQSPRQQIHASTEVTSTLGTGRSSPSSSPVRISMSWIRTWSYMSVTTSPNVWTSAKRSVATSSYCRRQYKESSTPRKKR